MTDAKRAQKVLHSVKAHGIIHSRHGAFGKRLSHSPLKAVSRVRIPYALPFRTETNTQAFIDIESISVVVKYSLHLQQVFSFVRFLA